MNANSYDVPGTKGGNREDLRNILTILEPEETPFTSMVRKGQAPKSTLVEVQADILRKPRTNGTKEGQDAGKGNNKAKNRQRFGSYVQRIMDEYGVTDIQQSISKAGGTAAVTNELANSKAMTLREAKRDMEAVNCSDNEMQGGSDADMLTRGAFKWIQPATGTNTQTVQIVPSTFLPAAGAILSGIGSPAAFTEAQLNGVLKTIGRVYGGKQEMVCIAGDNVIEVVDNFTRVQPSATNQRYVVSQDASEHEISLSVKVFDSSFVRLTMIPSQFLKVDVNGDCDPNAALILNMGLWENLFLTDLYAEDGPETAGGQTGYIKAVWANMCRNPKGNGKLYNT